MTDESIVEVRVGEFAQFDDYLENEAGEVVFNMGGVVVLLLEDGSCWAGPAHQVIGNWPDRASFLADKAAAPRQSAG